MSRRIVHRIDDFDLTGFLKEAQAFGSDRFGYVVTPNVDHMIRFHEEESFRDLYSRASYVLLDSRVAAFLFRLVHGVRVRVCTGSDLTAAVMERLVQPADRIVVVGGSPEQAQALKRRFGLQDFHHMNPPMGFIRNPQSVEECLAFVEAASPFRFCLLAVGSPRQEVLARKLAERGRARGMALCIGASVDFLTGAERRAPAWMQRTGLEWLYRLLQNPRKMAWRYLVRGPKFFAYVGGDAVEVRSRQA